ncbi:hypothetical protein [Geodermatophilus sp. SYSU D00684]
MPESTRASAQVALHGSGDDGHFCRSKQGKQPAPVTIVTEMAPDSTVITGRRGRMTILGGRSPRVSA